jgi:hypothetical protein
MRKEKGEKEEEEEEEEVDALRNMGKGLILIGSNCHMPPPIHSLSQNQKKSPHHHQHAFSYARKTRLVRS